MNEQIPIAFTCTPAFKAAIVDKMQADLLQRWPEYPLARTAIENAFTISVYSVPNQTEDCLAFYDRATLRAYLTVMEAAQPAAPVEDKQP